MNSILKVQNLSVTYPEISEKAIEDVSFELKEGTLTALLGPNGSGKSSLIKAILGFIKYSGQILLYNKPVSENIEKIGYVPQNFRLDTSFPITVYEFLYLTGSKNARIEGVKENLSLVGLNNVENKQLSSLSGGQLQRVLIARALIRKPKILILDEPEAGIDIAAGEKFYKLILDLVKNEGITILMATHEIEIVRSFSDQVLCLNKNLICAGIPKEVITKEIFNKMYSSDITLHKHSHK